MSLRSKHLIGTAIFSLIAVATSAQVGKWMPLEKKELAKVFEKMNAWFKNTATYSVNITHASYENYTVTTPVDRSVGYFKKDKNNYHSFLLGIHTIQNKNYKVVIDSAEKVMMVANPTQLTWNDYELEDYLLILNNCTGLMVMDNGAEKKYRLESVKGSLIAYYEYSVNSEGLLKEVVSYYAQEIQKDPDDKNSAKVKPRICISFSEYSIGTALNYTEEFDENKYFIQKNKILMPLEKYKKFKLRDQRVYK